MAIKLRTGAFIAGTLCVGLLALLPCQAQSAQELKAGNATRAAGAMAISVGGEYHDPFEAVDALALAKKSDLVLVGRIKQVQGPKYLEIAHHMKDPQNPVAAMPLEQLKAQMFYVIDCDRVIKGDHSLAGNKLKWIDPNWSQNIHTDSIHGVTYSAKINNGIPQLQHGMFFLTKSGSGWRFTDKDHCVLPASPTAPKIAPDIDRAIAAELLHVLDTPLKILTEKGGAPGGESECGSRGNYSISAGELLMRDAIVVITQLPPDKYKQQLMDLAAGDYPPLTKLWAFAGLTHTGDWSSFPSVQKFLLDPAEDLRYVANYPFRLLNDKSMTGEREKVLSKLPTKQLVASLKSEDAHIRESASSLVAAKDDPQYTELLMSLADSDKSAEVRENARRGLQRLTNIDPKFWQKEPALAKEIALGKKTISPFGDSVKKGAIFNQGRLTKELNARFGTNASSLATLPDWVVSATRWKTTDFMGEKPENFERSLREAPQMEWSCEGTEDQQGRRKAWYTFTRKSEPKTEACAGAGESFVIRTTTVAFQVDLKGGKFPEMSADLTLPPLAILDVWQQEDDVIFKRQSRDSARLLRVTRIYGADGKAKRVAPSGREQSASIEEILAK